MPSFASRIARRRSTSDGHEEGLRVVGAGFGRTGTMSLKAALDQLGFGPTYHMTEVSKNPSHARLWNAAAAGRPVDWDELFYDYHSSVDWPGAHYYKVLMDVYPQAKIILTVRDSNAWYRSMCNTLFSLETSIAEAGRGHDVLTAAAGTLYDNRIWHDTFNGRFEDRTAAIATFERHNQEVQDCVAPERLLVFDVSSGWDPLCEFLEVQEPNEPFPRVNDTSAFRAYNRDLLDPAEVDPTR